MDPLCNRLACDCVQGYAQRRYDALGKFVQKRSGFKVHIRYGESLKEILRINPGRVDLIIGKRSVVEYDAGRQGMAVRPIAALTDKHGSIKLKGLFVVRSDDSANRLEDLGGYRIIFGPSWDKEKSIAAAYALGAAGVSVAGELVRSSTCNAAALAVVEKEANAAVISSYALALLEGCDTIDKGALKVVGYTDDVDFVTVFAAKSAKAELLRPAIEALLLVKEDKSLLGQMESRDGFVRLGDEETEISGSGRNDWPDWRGRNRDGASSDVPGKLPEEARFLWRHDLTGVALLGIAATSKHVVAADKDEAGQSDIFRCLDADSGVEIWNITYPAAEDMDYSNCPRANPVICGAMVYLLGAFGDLHCVRLADGEVKWKKNIVTYFGAELPTWGTCSAPLIVDDKLIVNPGAKDASLVALDRLGGEVIWKAPGDPSAYASFIVGRFGNVRQIVGYDCISTGGWDVQTGKRLWRLVPPIEGDFNVPTPINLDGRLLLSSENNGTRLYEFNDDGTIRPEPVAVNADLAPDSHTPIAYKHMVFGSSGGSLLCLDGDGGLKTLWSAEDEAFYDYLTIIAGNNRALVTTLEGELVLIEAMRDEYRVRSRLRLFEKTEVWSHAALVGGRLYIRNDAQVCCLLLND
jgi:ABC-type phosphate/phosphonate transport system substrate-binding protein